MEGEIRAPVIALHAAYVIFGFILMAAGTAVARKLKQASGWLNAHRFLGVSGSAFTMAGFIQAILMVSLSGNEHFEIPHAYMGMIIVFFAFLSPLTGQLQLKIRNPAPAIRTIHRWTGRLILIFMLLNFIFGLALL